MGKKTSTKITLETERLLFISGRRRFFARCEACGDEVRLVTVDESAAMAGVNSLSVYRWIEAGKLHCTETATGAVLICNASLAEFISNRRDYT